MSRYDMSDAVCGATSAWTPRAPALDPEQEKILNDPELNAFLSARRRREPLDMPLLEKFLKAVEIGMARRASIWRDGGGKWRLFFAAGGDMNEGRLRGVGIVDREAVETARRHLPLRNKYYERKRKQREAIRRSCGYR